LRRGQRGPAVGSGKALSRRPPCRHARHQEQEAGIGRREETVEAERYRTRARRFDSFAALAARRYSAWSAAPFLRLRVSAQEIARCAAFGAGVEVRGWQADRGERI